MLIPFHLGNNKRAVHFWQSFSILIQQKFLRHFVEDLTHSVDMVAYGRTYFLLIVKKVYRVKHVQIVYLTS